MYELGFKEGRGTKDQIANTHWIIEKAREFQKNIYFFFIDYAKTFDCGSQQTGKLFIFIPSQTKSMPKNVQTTSSSSSSATELN